MISGSRFKCDPNPAIAGEPAEIFYLGPAKTVEIQVDGNSPFSAAPDQNGRILISAVPPGDELVMSDNLGIPGYLLVPIVEFS